MAKFQKQTGSQTSKGKLSALKKHNIFKKHKCHPSPSKRLLMMQRRIKSLINEQKSLQERNRDLFNSLKTERLLSASLKKESFNWQRKYHESVISLNSFKVKQAEMVQTLSICLGDIDTLFPHMVALSTHITSNKIMLTNTLASLHSADHIVLPRKFQSNEEDENSPNRNGKPMKQRVGPMVKGHLIRKPKIMLERLMWPQPQDQDAGSPNVSNIESAHQLTTIPEEDDEQEEDIRLRHVSVRPKRRRLGRSWKLTTKGSTLRERERERPDEPHSSRELYEGDSSDMDGNQVPASGHRVEPVLRLKDVSRMLQNSSLVQVEPTRAGDGEVGGSSTSRQREAESEPHHRPVVRAPDDPLEGSSFMFNNHNHRITFQPSQLNKKRSSFYNSDSSDDEHDSLDVQNVPNVSSMNTLLVNNQTFGISDSTRKDSLSMQSSHDSLAGSSDSTNTIDVEPNNEARFTEPVEDSKEMVNLVTQSNQVTEETLNETKIDNKELYTSNSLFVELPNERPNSESPSSSGSCARKSSKKQSDSFGGCNPAYPELSGKRVRKQKVIILPGEEEISASSKRKSTNIKIPKCSTVKKTCGDKTKSGKRSENKKRNKSSVTSNSRLEDSSASEGSERPRRNKQAVSYKEKSMNIKERRP